MDNMAIGIDFGTSNSCAACYFDGKLKVLENAEGNRVTPSVVYYTEKNGIIVGDFAKTMSYSKPEYFVYEIKRLIGRKTSDSNIQQNLKYFQFKLDPNSTEPLILIEQPKQTLRKTPQEISTTILKKIKSDAESKFGCEVKNAVITVPAYFNVNQREATLLAAQEAGFTVLKLLNEPTAAALSYFHEKNTSSKKYYLVFDFGGGTFDVAILKRNDKDIEIIAVDGDTHLGGQDIDNLLLHFVCKKLQRDYKYNPRSDRRAMRRLRKHCEEAKKELSYVEDTTMILYAVNDTVIEINIKRTQLEDLTVGFFRKSLQIVENCLKNCNLLRNDIEEIILSGGTTRIPKLQQLLAEFFDKPLEKFNNPDECVAEGAAIQAAMLSTNPRQQIQHIKITDVLALSLGVDVFPNLMDFLIKRNTPLPVTESLNLYTVYNNQTSALCKIYEGERPNANKNRFLGELTISNLTPAPPRQCSIILSLSIDKNGILTAKAEEKNKNNIKELTVTYTRGVQSENEVRNALKDAEDNKEEDEKFIKFATYKSYLTEYCIAVAYNLEKANLDKTNQELYDYCLNTETKVQGMEMNDEEEFKRMIKETESKCQPLIEKYNFEDIPTFEAITKRIKSLYL